MLMESLSWWARFGSFSGEQRTAAHALEGQYHQHDGLGIEGNQMLLQKLGFAQRVRRRRAVSVGVRRCRRVELCICERRRNGVCVAGSGKRSGGALRRRQMGELWVLRSVGSNQLRQHSERMAVAMVTVCMNHPVHGRALRRRLVRLRSSHSATVLAPAAQWESTVVTHPRLAEKLGDLSVPSVAGTLGSLRFARS
jgi:hypothetical protein